MEVGDSISQVGGGKQSSILPPILPGSIQLTKERVQKLDEEEKSSGLMQKVRVVLNSRVMSKRGSPREL